VRGHQQLNTGGWGWVERGKGRAREGRRKRVVFLE
jgi:hypothetical protein